VQEARQIERLPMAPINDPIQGLASSVDGR